MKDKKADTFLMRMTEEMKSEIMECATELNISMSAFVTLAIKEKIANFKKTKM